MKKFFALFTVIALLAVTGSAFAANPTITVTPTSVTVEAGKTATATVTTAPANRGTVSVSTSVAWATVSGTTVTFAPSTSVAANSYTVTLTATETWTSGDVAGHHTSEKATAEATVTVTVTAAPVDHNDDGSSEAATKTVVPIVKKIAVKVMAVRLAVFPTIASMGVINTTVSTSVTSMLADLISDLSTLLKITVPATAEVQESTNMVAVPTSSYVAGKNEDNLKKAAAKLQYKLGKKTNKRAAGVVPPFKAVKSGIQLMKLMDKIDSALVGLIIGLDMGNTAGASSTPVTTDGAFFAADAEGNNEVVFLDDAGKKITTFPSSGGVTAVAYVEAGATYEPIVTVDTGDDEAAFDTKTGSTSETVDVEVEEEVLSTSDGTFSAAVDDDVLEAIGTKLGKSVDMLPSSVTSTKKAATTATEEAYMLSNDLFLVYAFPSLAGIPDGTYAVKITFQNTPPEGDTIGVPVLYPDSVKANGDVNVKVYVVTKEETSATATEITASNAATYVKNSQDAYVVFKVESDAIVAADEGTVSAAAASLANASLVVSATDDDEPTPPTPGARDPDGPGGSSGGCSAGFSALALAVLGGFIATRRK